MPGEMPASGASSMMSYRDANQGSPLKCADTPPPPPFAQGFKQPHGASHTSLTPDSKKATTGQNTFDGSKGFRRLLMGVSDKFSNCVHFLRGITRRAGLKQIKNGVAKKSMPTSRH